VLSGGSAWLAVTFSIYAGYFVPLTPTTSKMMSIGLIAALSAVNYLGVREGTWVQRTFTLLKIAAILVLIGAAFLTPHSTAVPKASDHLPVSFARFGVAMTACLMAYNGWSYVSFVAGEVREPQRNLLRAMAIGMAAVMVLYVLANLAYLRVMTITGNRLDRARRSGPGNADDGLDGRNFCVSHRPAFDYRGGERVHFDGRASPLRTGPGPAVLRSLRTGSSPVSDAGLRHSVGRALDRDPRPQRLIRDPLFLLHTG